MWIVIVKCSITKKRGGLYSASQGEFLLFHSPRSSPISLPWACEWFWPHVTETQPTGGAAVKVKVYVRWETGVRLSKKWLQAKRTDHVKTVSSVFLSLSVSSYLCIGTNFTSTPQHVHIRAQLQAFKSHFSNSTPAWHLPAWGVLASLTSTH